MPLPPDSPLGELEQEPSPLPRETLSRPWRKELPVLVLLALVSLGFAAWVLTANQRALRDMEPGDRALLFQKSWQAFHALCLQGTDPRLLPQCREQARFLRDFPECEDGCREQLAPFRHQATR